MFRIAQEDPDLTGVPVDLVELIRDCLSKDPAARPTTDAILERLADDDTAEPWLPGALIAQLGRHAVELLDSEDPEEAAEVAEEAPLPDMAPPLPPAPTDRPVHTRPTIVDAPAPTPSPARPPDSPRPRTAIRH